MKEKHITELDEGLRRFYAQKLVTKRTEELRSYLYPTNEELKLIFGNRRLPPPEKIYIGLSPGPGEDEKGAPGLGSAVALKLILNALKPWDREKVEAITYTAEGYTDEKWVEEVRKFATAQGVKWKEYDITETNDAVMKSLAGKEYTALKFTSLTILRTMMPQLLDEFSATVAGYNKLGYQLYRILRGSEDAKIAPVKYWDRTEIMYVAKHLGLDINIINQRPSNGSKELEGVRMMRFFPENTNYSFKIAELLDYTCYLKERGLGDKDITSDVSEWSKNNQVFTVDIPSFIEQVSKAYDRYKDQLKVI